MVIIKTPEQVDGIRKSCALLASVMRELKTLVKPGITPAELNTIAEQRIIDAGARPAFKGYPSHYGGDDFPTGLCASVNQVVVHGPSTSEEPLQEGDIIGMDLGAELNGYYSDMAVTMPVGKIDPKVEQLMAVTKKSLENGIKQMVPGNKVEDIARAIENTITPHGYGIVEDYVGHGVGIAVHEDPNIPNMVTERMRSELNTVLKPGMVLAVEPMVTLGSADVDTLEDGWSVATLDGQYAAHYEHTIAILEDGYEVLTKLD
jgi:methionyl aminopeptidase